MKAQMKNQVKNKMKSKNEINLSLTVNSVIVSEPFRWFIYFLFFYFQFFRFLLLEEGFGLSGRAKEKVVDLDL
jgi:hypothetical protein